MIDEPGSFSGIVSSREARARAARVPAHVVGDLHQRAGERAQRGAGVDHRVVRRQRGELVRAPTRTACRSPRRSCAPPPRRSAACALRPVPTAVPPIASAIEPVQRRLDAVAARGRAARPSRRSPGRASPASRPAGACGRPSRRRRTRAPWRRACRAAAATAGSSSSSTLLDRRDVHHRREGVVRRLAAVDVVVGMDRRLGADHAAGELDRAVGDHLVGVHVRSACPSRSGTRPAGTRRRACRRSPPAPRATIRSTFSRGSCPSSPLASARAFLSTPSARITGRPQRKRSTPIGKFSIERCVCAPHSRSAGTSTLRRARPSRCGSP